jgi:hypothetical protein
MLRFPCGSLRSLAKLLRERYDARNKMVIRNFSDPEMLAIEYEIIRINKLITRHRRRCPHCKVQESLVTLNPKRIRSLSPETPYFSLDMIS